MSLGVGVLGNGVLGAEASSLTGARTDFIELTVDTSFGGYATCDFFTLSTERPLGARSNFFSLSTDSDPGAFARINFLQLDTRSNAFEPNSVGVKSSFLTLSTSSEPGAYSKAKLFKLESRGLVTESFNGFSRSKFFSLSTSAAASQELTGYAEGSLFKFKTSCSFGAYSESKLFSFKTQSVTSRDEIASNSTGFFKLKTQAYGGWVASSSCNFFSLTTDSLPGAYARPSFLSFSTNGNAQVEAIGFSEATVLNLNTLETSRYTNYPFFYLMPLGGKLYGIKSDGFYEITGLTDYDPVSPVPVNGTLITKDSDFGAFNSKRVPYLYVNGDSQVKITPIVDGVVKTYHLSSFGGRKTHLARGVSGRYWQFKIENIIKCEGLEPLPELGKRQRRVK
jgi:hypothetical protein